MLLLLISSVLGSQPEASSDLFLNRLNMSFCINYKYSGLLHHSIDRVWIVTKVALPKLEDIHFPDIAFDPDCAFVKSLKHSGPHIVNIRSLCRPMKPIIKYEKESFCENTIRNVLKEEIPRSLHGSGYSHVSHSNQDPVSAGQRFLHSNNRETPVHRKKALSALIPAIASLATIVVESLNSFLQRKRNKAMANGMTAIKKDQSLAWNSLKQFENDFLLYGKYNVAQLHDIVNTVNGLRNRTLLIERLLTGQDMHTLQTAL